MKKYKVLWNKKVNEVRIEYFKVEDKTPFRYKILKDLLANDELVLWIDTNLNSGKEQAIQYVKRMETYLAQHHIALEIVPVQSTKDKKIFGIPIKKSDERAFVLLFPIKGEDLTEEFFEMFLAEGDVMFGIRPKVTYEEIVKDVKQGFIKGCFEKDYFEDALYDSVLISAMRTTLIAAKDV